MLGQAKALALMTLGLTQAASAVGHAYVYNNCDFGVTLWSVGSNIAPSNYLDSRSNYFETFTVDPTTGGRALKITREPDGLFTAKPQTVFAYNLRDGAVWYDLNDVYGDPFAGHKLLLRSADRSCPSIVWPQGIPPGGSQVKNCRDGADVILTLCAERPIPGAAEESA
ncbi:uncharacterized protein UV8b_03367 [Ustilaginoidea virens]|uniref:Uncharacterized protein n=1 Tax=Ustilaginoidea virens TaxID=1159556 RepID=A0A063C2M4_USTVR|nr:uncharacterized protein UV8b_03367 [Ustilaginoidea virens]QUC19126.1 hypothetical protein UV8b_03367 [Ustilaginoidea virens]GAO18939.1 hypothetical protein UVI_02058770 [Ustilaginoidea virens]